MEATDKLTIRQATVEDVNGAVTLILLAASNLLSPLFGNGDDQRAKEFLHHAWQMRKGQYGSDSHFVAVIDEKVVGMVTGWFAGMPKEFTQQTLLSLNSFYGLKEAQVVCKRSSKITKDIKSPIHNELVIGHFAVLPHYQGKGIAAALINHMEQRAIQMDKSVCIVDAEAQNQRALAFYKKQGYSEDKRQSGKTIIRLRKTVIHI